MITFKDKSVEAEFNQLPVHNKRMRDLLTALEVFVRLELKKEVMLTEVYRDPTTNAAQGGIPNSPHMVWNAVDLRSWIYTEEEIQKILNFLNCFTYRSPKKTAVYHAVPGGAFHFHIQCLKEGEK